MAHVIRCPHCQKPTQVPDQALGKRVGCPNCKQPIQLPASIPAPAPPPPPAPAPAPAGNGGTALSASGLISTSGLMETLSGTACPSCGAKLLEGAVACMDCGFLLKSDAPDEKEGAPLLCPNTACGVANTPGTRYCSRCNSPLPMSGGTMLSGRYRLDKLLKIGGFGAVYMGVDTKSQERAVAVKDMIGNDPQEFQIRLNFFRREAEILRILESVPIVPRVYDFIHQGQTAHLVMEFIKGRDLLDLLEANGNKPFPLPLVVEWGKSICDVLATMHSQQPPLIHRDLKPDNLMLLEDQRSIKMIDFGTARDMGRTAKERREGKTRVYTEGYAPPEQIVGKPEARSDLFALAATLYHLATGKAPEGFYTAKEIETQLADANGPLPAAFRWFFELIRINLAEDVNDRYFTAREFKADLTRQQVTREVKCAKCATANKVRTPFCTKCAEPLTEAAPHCNMCGKNNHMGTRFCIHCGNRLR